MYGFYVKKKVTIRKRTETESVQIKGKALLLSYNLRSGLGYSVSCVPTNSICLEHRSNYYIWLKSHRDNQLLLSSLVKSCNNYQENDTPNVN